MILVMTLQHACSGSLSHFKFQSSSALYCHKWARSQLILNHHIISASGVSTKKSDYVQRHLLKTPRFSKSGRKSWVTPLRQPDRKICRHKISIDFDWYIYIPLKIFSRNGWGPNFQAWTIFLYFQNAGRQGATRETITGVHSLTEYCVQIHLRISTDV